MIPIRPKDRSVRPLSLSPAILFALEVARGVWEKYGAKELVVTSLNDGKHRKASLHYSGNAVDLRTKNVPMASSRRAAADELRALLHEDYDVVLEDFAGDNEHVHVEWQPMAAPGGVRA